MHVVGFLVFAVCIVALTVILISAVSIFFYHLADPKFYPLNWRMVVFTWYLNWLEKKEKIND